MSDRIDHAAEAEIFLDWAESWDTGDEWARADYLVKRAQAHATLALVEQQRIANVLATTGLSFDLEATPEAGVMVHGIFAALGIGQEGKP